MPRVDWFKRHWMKIAIGAAVAFVGAVVAIFEGYEYFDRAPLSGPYAPKAA